MIPIDPKVRDNVLDHFEASLRSVPFTLTSHELILTADLLNKRVYVVGDWLHRISHRVEWRWLHAVVASRPVRWWERTMRFGPRTIDRQARALANHIDEEIARIYARRY